MFSLSKPKLSCREKKSLVASIVLPLVMMYLKATQELVSSLQIHLKQPLLENLLSEIIVEVIKVSTFTIQSEDNNKK